MWYSVEKEALFATLQTNETGLTETEAQRRLKEYGRNELKQTKRKHPVVRFFGAFADKMTLVLFAAAVVSFVLDLYAGKMSIDPFVILAIVVINAVVSLVQESKAEKALDALKRISTPECTVLRDGKEMKIGSTLLVPGDIVFLEKGMVVPCDGRLIECYGLTTDEAALTGESGGVNKNASLIFPEGTHTGDIANAVWSGTSVLTGKGKFVAVSTGMETAMGKIASLLTEKDEKTPLQKRLAKLSGILGNLTICICALIFILSVFKGLEPKEMFLTSVGLAVAAIPEGLPAIVTIVLSLGVQRMAKHHAVVRRLPAVETLGCAGVICSDKTGTLTQNKMTVTDCFEESELLFEACILCGDDASPTEHALITFAKEKSTHADALIKKYPRVSEIPFDSDKKYMVTAHRTENGFRLFLKGAPDVIGAYCNNIPGKADLRLREMADKGMRVIGLAYADTKNLPGDLLSVKYDFLGLCGLEDPPREGVKEAVRSCKEAGILPVMITGDHADTARAIAAEIGILTDESECVTEAELKDLTDKELAKRVKRCTVFARTTPAFKMRVVEAYRANGYAVAMTGDGVNDAPALKKADIGCAMGKGGTEVAREASDLVLTDDNFATIVEAVREGRTIYGNIRRTVHFLISCNIGEIVTMLLGILLSLPAPLVAIQLLWVNLVTDSLPAIALGLEKPGSDVMKKPPSGREEPLFRKWRWIEIMTEGLLIGVISIVAFCIGLRRGEMATARTMAFTVLAVSQLFHAFNMRSENSILTLSPFSNPLLTVSFFVGIALQVLLVCVPFCNTLFQTAALSGIEWGVCGALCLSPVLFCEAYKKIKN